MPLRQNLHLISPRCINFSHHTDSQLTQSCGTPIASGRDVVGLYEFQP